MLSKYLFSIKILTRSKEFCKWLQERAPSSIQLLELDSSSMIRKGWIRLKFSSFCIPYSMFSNNADSIICFLSFLSVKGIRISWRTCDTSIFCLWEEWELGCQFSSTAKLWWRLKGTFFLISLHTSALH